MSDETVEPGKYYEPQERLTRLAALATEAMMASPEWGDDVRGAFMLHDEENGSGACLLGYPEGEEVSFESMADVVQHIRVLFKSIGIDMELNMVTREKAPAAEDLEKLLDDGQEAEVPLPSGDEQQVVLTLTADAPDEQMAVLCTAVKKAVEASTGLGDTQLILLMRHGTGSGAIMHHGYATHHDMAHGLFEAFQQVIAAEGGKIAVIPIMDPGMLN